MFRGRISHTTTESFYTNGQNIFVLVDLTPTSSLVLAQHLCWQMHDRRHKCICAGGCLKRLPAQINSDHFKILK